MFDKFKNNPYVEHAFYGVRPAMTGMIASVALGLIGSAVLNDFNGQIQTVFASLDVRAVILFFIFLILTNKLKLHPIFYIILAGILGALLKL